jgi:hypothetical protein
MSRRHASDKHAVGEFIRVGVIQVSFDAPMGMGKYRVMS